MTVNYKFCGGCNPRYDRVALAQKMEETFPDITFRQGATEDADATVVICGCIAACAQVTDSYGSHGRFVMWGESAWDNLCEFLNKISE